MLNIKKVKVKVKVRASRVTVSVRICRPESPDVCTNVWSVLTSKYASKYQPSITNPIGTAGICRYRPPVHISARFHLMFSTLQTRDYSSPVFVIVVFFNCQSPTTLLPLTSAIFESRRCQHRLAERREITRGCCC